MTAPNPGSRGPGALSWPPWAPGMLATPSHAENKNKDLKGQDPGPLASHTPETDAPTRAHWNRGPRRKPTCALLPTPVPAALPHQGSVLEHQGSITVGTPQPGSPPPPPTHPPPAGPALHSGRTDTPIFQEGVTWSPPAFPGSLLSPGGLFQQLPRGWRDGSAVNTDDGRSWLLPPPHGPSSRV